MSFLVSSYAVLGVLLLLSSAIYRLLPMALEPLSGTLEPVHLFAYASSVLFFAYSEGYRGFQKQFSPRVVARALIVARQKRMLSWLLAPPVAMGLLHATKKRLIISWSITLGVIVLILLMRMLAQPWRGIIDAGVVVGLSWGAVAILVFWIRSLAGSPPSIEPEFPG